MSNERNRDFGGAQSRNFDRGAGRESGEDALLELARLIGGQNDPFGPDAPPPAADPPESRLADVSRTVAAKSYEERAFEDRGAPSRRDPDFGNRAPPPPEADRDYDFGDRSRGGRGRLDYGVAHEDEYADDEYTEPADFDDEPGGRRRPGRMITMVLGLAVFGGAAAYGYRTMVAAPSEPPPIIRADKSPTKITPMSDAKPESKRSASLGEQMLRREEDPVGAFGGGNGGNRDVGSTDVVPPSPETATRDPKRVHTVAIRPDQGTATSPDRPVTRAVPPPPSAPPPQSALPSQPAPPPQPSPPPPRVAAQPSPPPLRQTPAPAPPPAPPQLRQAAAAPADTAASESGSYLVQLTAVKSESDAQSEFRRLQAKYTVLNGRPPVIRRKDQGERGVVFAAAVGPFGAKGEADQVCDQIKAAGGTCYVYRN